MRTLKIITCASLTGAYLGATLVLHLLVDGDLIDQIRGRR